MHHLTADRHRRIHRVAAARLALAAAAVLSSGVLGSDRALSRPASGGSGVAPASRRFEATIAPLAPREAAAMVASGVHRDGCPVAIRDLALVTFAYWNKQGRRSVGRLVVHRTVAEDMS